MSSLPVIGKSWSFQGDAAASGKVEQAQVDSQLQAIFSYLNGNVRDVLARVLRDDDTLTDNLVRLRNLALEVSTIIASQGWQPKAAVTLATTANVALTGEQTIDGVLTSLTRILVKDQTLPAQNGIYVTAPGAWTRATDVDTATEIGYAAVMVLGGTANAGKSYVVTAAPTAITLGTTSIVWAQFGSSGSGGGSSSSTGGGLGYNVKNAPFGAYGDGVSHPLTAGQAADFNTAFASVGFQGANAVVAGDEHDWAAIQAAMYTAGAGGGYVYLPAGIYFTNKPLSLRWSNSPITGQPQFPKCGGIYGDGKQSEIHGLISTSGSGILELLGETNPVAVNTEIHNFRLYHRVGSHLASCCLRVGDCNSGFSARRIWCEGINGMRLKISNAASYSQIDTHFQDCKFDANYGQLYGAQAASPYYAVIPESQVALWDNVHFDSCIFGGVVVTYALLCRLTNCQFYTSTFRTSTLTININSVNWTFNCYTNLIVPLANCDVIGCYFEDHRVAIEIQDQIYSSNCVNIEQCHFSAFNNEVGAPKPTSAVKWTHFATGNFPGVIRIHGCRMNNDQVGNVGYSKTLDITSTMLVMSGNVNYYNKDISITVGSDLTGTKIYNIDPAQGTADLESVTTRALQTAFLSVPRNGLGNVAHDGWGLQIGNAAGNDEYLLFCASSLYQPGGAIASVTNSCVFEYIPLGTNRRTVFAGSANYIDLGAGLLTYSGMAITSNSPISTTSRLFAGPTALTNDDGVSAAQIDGQLLMKADKPIGFKIGKKCGNDTLVAGTKTIANTAITANSIVLCQFFGITNAGHIGITLSAGVSFTVTSSNAADVRNFNWIVFEKVP